MVADRVGESRAGTEFIAEPDVASPRGATGENMRPEAASVNGLGLTAYARILYRPAVP